MSVSQRHSSGVSLSALLLDEPTASLDADAANRITTLVDEWAAAEPGRAFVWIGHDPALIRPIASRELLCERGELSEVS